MRRYALPLVLFAVSFAAAFGGAYSWRNNENGAADVVAPATTVATTAVPSTLSTTTTTLTLEPPDSTVPPDTTAPPEETVPIVTEPAPLEEPDLSPSGSFLAPVGDEAIPYDDALGCLSLSAAIEDCDQVEASGTTLAWIKENADSGGRLVLYRVDGAEGERVATAVLATDTGDASAVRVRQADVTDDGALDIVVGKHLFDGTLSLDVVSGRGGEPGVVLHLDLEGGKAVLSDGQVVVFRARPAGGETAENPSQYQKWVVVPSGDGWSLAENSLVDAEQVGGSQL